MDANTKNQPLIPAQRQPMTRVILEANGRELTSVWSPAPLAASTTVHSILSRTIVVHPSLANRDWKVYRVEQDETGQQVAFARTV